MISRTSSFFAFTEANKNLLVFESPCCISLIVFLLGLIGQRPVLAWNHIRRRIVTYDRDAWQNISRINFQYGTEPVYGSQLIESVTRQGADLSWPL